MIIVINNDLDKHIQEKTSDKRVRRFGDILAPLSRETKLTKTIIITTIIIIIIIIIITIIMLKRR